MVEDELSEQLKQLQNAESQFGSPANPSITANLDDSPDKSHKRTPKKNFKVKRPVKPEQSKELLESKKKTKSRKVLVQSTALVHRL